MSDENNPATDPTPPNIFNEGFTQGGDLTLRSTDGVDFSVHSILLSLASPVFTDLLRNGNKNEIIQFSENADMLALMLKFIYPKPTPNVSSTDLFDNALRVADKYQIENMKSRLLEQFIRIDSPALVYTDPIRAFYVLSAHGLTTEARLAASLASKEHDLGQEENLKEFLDLAPNPTAAAHIELTGTLLVKTRVLVDVLFRFEESPMKIKNNVESLEYPAKSTSLANTMGALDF